MDFLPTPTFATPINTSIANKNTSIAKTTSSSQVNNEIHKKAEELEGVFLNTLMSQMFSSLESDGLFGGGHAEETWRSMQSEQYADIMSQNGGVGMADQIMANLLAIQENANAPAAISAQANNNNPYLLNKEAQ
jgi:Rod binding domain-containing protein